MKIIYKTGDCLKGDERFVVHGCNAQGVMGSGIALQVRNEFPEAYQAYRRAYEEREDRTKGLPLGNTIWAPSNGKIIINGITQEFYGPDAHKGVVYVDYDAVARVMKNINANAFFTQTVEQHRQAYGGIIDAVAMPLIGAVRAGGSWKKISEIIERESTNFQPVVYLFDGVMPTN